MSDKSVTTVLDWPSRYHQPTPKFPHWNVGNESGTTPAHSNERREEDDEAATITPSQKRIEAFNLMKEYSTLSPDFITGPDFDSQAMSMIEQLEQQGALDGAIALMKSDIAKVRAGQDVEMPEKCAMCGKPFTENDHPMAIEGLGYVHDYEVTYQDAGHGHEEEANVNVYENVMRIEEGEYGTEEELASLMQPLIDSGVAYQLEGFFGRLAEALIQKGLCTPQTTKAEAMGQGQGQGQGYGQQGQGQSQSHGQSPMQSPSMGQGQNQGEPHTHSAGKWPYQEAIEKCPMCGWDGAKSREELQNHLFTYHMGGKSEADVEDFNAPTVATFCGRHKKPYKQHSPAEFLEDTPEDIYYEQDDPLAQDQGKEMSVPQPQDQQDMLPMSQSQFVPTSDVGFQQKGDEGYPEKNFCGRHSKSWLSHSQGELDEDIGSGHKTDEIVPFQPLSPAGFEPIEPSHSSSDDDESHKCPYCGEERGSTASLIDHIFYMHEHPESNPFPGSKWEGPLSDPRERDARAKEKAQNASMPGEGLSPEAQHIAGIDPASQAERQQGKPKLEVDVSDKITILGKTGSGKTNLIKVLLSDILKDYQFVVLDALGNLSEYEGLPNVDYHQVTPSDTADVDQILYSALEKGDCMIVMDEVDRYDTKKGTMLNELVNVGRNYGVGGIFAARRTADVDKDILANSPYIFTFQHILPQDLDVLIDWFAQPEETFRDLQPFEAILFHNGEQIWQGVVPEKPTTKPSKRPSMPKKPKSKGKEPPKGGGQPPPEGGQPPEQGGGEGMQGQGQGQGQPAEKEPVPEKKPPELTPADQGEVQEMQKSEALWQEVMKEEGPDEESEGDVQPKHRKVKDPTDPHSCLCCDIGECACRDCDECDPDYMSDVELEKDEEVYHNANAPFTCPDDGQQFKYEKDWLDHVEGHGGQR